MKKIICSLLFTALAAGLFAQEFSVSGEVKTGLLWNKNEDKYEPFVPTEQTLIHSNDYAGNDQGRFRLNMEYAVKNIGIKLRFNLEDWGASNLPTLPYAFGYGNFFDNQLTVSIGKLGASPWGTGGPEMRVELEDISKGGMRVEYKPFFVPGLNVGFILNGFDGSTDIWKKETYPGSYSWIAIPFTFLNLLEESVIGLAYTHDFFHVNAAYRFDSEADNRYMSTAGFSGKDGGDFAYRVEERVLRNLFPGSRVWAQGYFSGIGADKDNEEVPVVSFNNLLYLEYAPDLFTAQIRLGYARGYDEGEGHGLEYGGHDKSPLFNQRVVHVRPGFYLNLFDKKLIVGGSFWYGQDFGEGKIYKDSPFLFMEVEPKIQYNIAPNIYMALVYNFSKVYVSDEFNSYSDENQVPIAQNQWVNLRFGISF
jgi:hypothetical protein